MSRVASIWMGLLKAGAVALVLALFGVATASAHAHHAAPATTAQTQHHHRAVVSPAGDCHGQQAEAPAEIDHGTHTAPGHGAGHDCCKDACRCPVTCAAHLVTGTPQVAVLMVPPVSLSILLPGRTLDPAGLETPPDPRPPLSI